MPQEKELRQGTSRHFSYREKLSQPTDGCAPSRYLAVWSRATVIFGENSPRRGNLCVFITSFQIQDRSRPPPMTRASGTVMIDTTAAIKQAFNSNDQSRDEFKNGSRRRKEADSGAKSFSASLPARRLRLSRRFSNSPS